MNRMEEFIEMRQGLEETPVALEYIAKKAVKKVITHKKVARLWKTSLISLCTTVTSFILLVNFFPSVALAMSNVPILKDLVAAVAFSPSLKAAVENDYYQVVGESQTKDNVTVTVEYMIVDAGHISLFFSVDAPVKKGTYRYDFTDSGKWPFQASICFDTMYEVGKLEELKIDFVDGNEIPDEIVFTVNINQDENFQEWQSATVEVPASDLDTSVIPTLEAADKGTDFSFQFVLHPDLQFAKTVSTYPINQWIEIKNQKIYLDRLDIYPTQARLHFTCDENNEAIVDELNIYFKDNKDKTYRVTNNGLVGSYAADTFNINSLYFESSYFSNADKLTMYINGISTIDKDKLYGEIDVAHKTISNLPDGVTVDTMDLKDSTLHYVLKAKSNHPGTTSEIVYPGYYDQDKKPYSYESWSYSSYTNDEDYFYADYHIKDFEENKYLIRWSYSNTQELEKPIEIFIK